MVFSLRAYVEEKTPHAQSAYLPHSSGTILNYALKICHPG